MSGISQTDSQILTSKKIVSNIGSPIGALVISFVRMSLLDPNGHSGWQIMNGYYASRIHRLLGTMMALRDHLLPENRALVDSYLADISPPTLELLMGLPRTERPDLQHKFLAYTNVEEQRLKRNLEALNHVIDAVDTAYVVAGTEKIEKV